MEKIRVLFVCLGNICRSPLAEAVFKHKTEKSDLSSFFEVDSCGTGNYHIGEQPDPRTRANAKRNGINMDHCCRQLTVRDLEYFDYILAMDNSNLQNILRLSNAHQHRSKIALMREFDPENPNAEVPDPYFGGEEGFQDVFDILDRTMEHFIEHLRARHSLS